MATRWWLLKGDDEMQELTKELAISVPIGTVFHYSHGTSKGARVERWRKSGQTKVWKTRPDEWRMPVKHGMYSNSYITEVEAEHFHLESECETQGTRVT